MKARGFTLVELLVAAAVTGVVLTAAYGWLWNVAAFAGRTDDRSQASSIAAACSRAVVRDVAASLAVVPPPSGRDPARALALRHDRPGAAGEDVLVAWDPARGVLWRNASGTYIGDHVTGFGIAYLLDDGRLVAGEDMQAGEWSAVRGVRVALAVSVGSSEQERRFFVAVRAS